MIGYIIQWALRNRLFIVLGALLLLAAINTGEFDYVVTTPAYDQDDPEASAAPIERAWLSAATASATRIGGGDLVDVWALDGPLDPSVCGRLPTS